MCCFNSAIEIKVTLTFTKGFFLHDVAPCTPNVAIFETLVI